MINDNCTQDTYLSLRIMLQYTAPGASDIDSISGFGVGGREGQSLIVNMKIKGMLAS